jgi:DNA-binding CsgD family transcriptional regulator
MTKSRASQSASLGAAPLGRMIGALGRRGFFPEIGQVLSEAWAADYMHVWIYEEHRPSILASMSADGSGFAEHLADDYMARHLWLHDTELMAGSAVPGTQSIWSHVSPDGLRSGAMRRFFSQAQLRDRMLLFGRQPYGVVGLSLVGRARGDAGVERREPLRLAAVDLAFELLMKHVELCQRRKEERDVLNSPVMMETIIRQSAEKLPWRLVQLAARFLAGMNAPAIAVDLGVTPETILSYRKRLYERLGVTSHRELLLWFLELQAELQLGCALRPHGNA